MDKTQKEVAELTLELCTEAIAHRCSMGEITVKDLSLYAKTLEQCEFAVQYYNQQQEDKGEETPW